MNQDPFQDIFPSSKVNPSHAAGFQTVSEGSFQHHAAMPQQLLAAFSTDSTAIGIDSLARCRCVSPIREDRPAVKVLEVF